ncbi:peptidoglycan DD-metalloendopeptidase family protein [Pseudolysinimonas sp.]|uniref:peptidoglycan DD-metalloendopeptidase family protein n=1 Tax=Pseudolysinimonas sp. TaxID=2680009 RepID=UPI003F7D21CC
MTGAGTTMRGTRIRMRAIAASIALALLPVGAFAGVPAAQAAEAAPTARMDYPTWQDVQNAQKAESTTQALVAQITAQLTQLKAASDAAQADAQAKGEAYGKAQDAYDEQDYKTQQLQAQADTAKKEADDARDKAARLVSQLSKTNGGTDSTATLLSHQGSADGQLYRLQAYNTLIRQSQGIYEHALQLQKNAQSLTDQAAVQKKLLADLKVKAQQALEAAQAAAQAAADAVQAETDHQADLQAQLAVLTQKRAATEADYQAGVAARAAAAAAAAAAQAAARISSSGWADPAYGVLLDPFGLRFHPIYHEWKLHSGQDIANSCGAPIFAAAAGTVVYAGWMGDLGNFIQIRHDDGTVTGYGHIVNGGMLVRIGQRVGSGQQIAKIGTTGGSTGCHLHFMVYEGGSTLVNPVPFMRDRGVKLGS